MRIRLGSYGSGQERCIKSIPVLTGEMDAHDAFWARSDLSGDVEFLVNDPDQRVQCSG